ncbi:MAG: hypothetical protein JW751_29460 [Polyangiaceae bacterium]|nr:hypothetical protein [Polyangiaceae bacterium]
MWVGRGEGMTCGVAVQGGERLLRMFFVGSGTATLTAILGLGPGCEIVAEPVRSGAAVRSAGHAAGTAGEPSIYCDLGIASFLNLAGEPSVPVDVGPECAPATRGTPPSPATVSTLLLVDRSARMALPANNPPWPHLKDALYALFITPPDPAVPLSLGISYFPSGEAEGVEVPLMVATYEAPQVVLAPLTAESVPVDVQERALIDTARATTLNGTSYVTPTVQAFRGTMGYAVEYAERHPKDRVVILLMTGGLPTVGYCHPDGPWIDGGDPVLCKSAGQLDSAPELVGLLKDIAQTGFLHEPSVRTYALSFWNGSAGPPEDIAAIAEAGGGRCFNCDVADSLLGNAEMTTAIYGYLVDLARNEFACQYPIGAEPAALGAGGAAGHGGTDSETDPGGEIDFEKVNVKYQAKGMSWDFASRVESPTDCGPGRWYFDDPTAPKQIIFCEDFCAQVREYLEDAEVEIVFGCRTIIK